MSLLKYKYYDTPEGCDIFKKLFVTSKYAAMTGLGMSTFDVLMYSHPKGIGASAYRVLSITGPIVGMATAFTVVTNVSQQIRGKNDQLNYFLGGASSGVVFSVWQKSPAIALPMAVFFGTIAVTKKMAVDSGYTFFPEVKIMKQNAYSHKNDWTMGPEYDNQKNFTTGN